MAKLREALIAMQKEKMELQAKFNDIVIQNKKYKEVAATYEPRSHQPPSPAQPPDAEWRVQDPRVGRSEEPAERGHPECRQRQQRLPKVPGPFTTHREYATLTQWATYQQH